MTSDLDKGEAPTERGRQRLFRIRMITGAACYLLATAVLDQWGEHRAGPWRLVFALLPLAPLAGMVIAMVWRLRQMDEYQLKQLVPSVTVGFIVTIVVALVLSSLNAAGLAVPDNGSFVSVVGVLAWALTYMGTGGANA